MERNYIYDLQIIDKEIKAIDETAMVISTNNGYQCFFPMLPNRGIGEQPCDIFKSQLKVNGVDTNGMAKNIMNNNEYVYVDVDSYRRYIDKNNIQPLTQY